MTKSAVNFKSVILRQRLEELRLRILKTSGINFEEDGQKLRQMREQARQIDDSDLELYVINVYGILHANTGRSDEAKLIYEEGSRLALEWNNHERWITFQLNLAVRDINAWQLPDARAVFEGLLPALRALPPTSDNITRLYLTYCNLGLLCIDLNDFDAAEAYARQYLAGWESPAAALIQQQRRAHIMGMARDILSWVHFARGEYEEARAQARLLLDLSQKEAQSGQIISAWLAFLRISLFDPTDTTEPEAHWQRILDLLQPQIDARDPGLWGTGNHDLILESKSYQMRGKLDWARRCAEKAVEILTALNDDQHRKMAEAVLAELSTR